jgi:uncharacterized protein YjbJ (UPF0337 family)
VDKDRIEGTVKEKAGKLTDDEKLEREGKAQESWGESKDKARDAWDKGKDAAEDAKESLDRRI